MDFTEKLINFSLFIWILELFTCRFIFTLRVNMPHVDLMRAKKPAFLVNHFNL